MREIKSQTVKGCVEFIRNFSNKALSVILYSDQDKEVSLCLI